MTLPVLSLLTFRRNLKAYKMRFLLDTHVFLWWILDDARLSSRVHGLIETGSNEILFSAASAWEIAIKAQLGKIMLPGKPDTFVSEQLNKNRFTALPVNVSHALRTYELPQLHRDPFDRLLVAQSLLEKLPILTSDSLIRQYSVEAVW